MLPNELEEEIITLPKTETHTIVIVTGKDLRHQRFALRVIDEFKDQVLAWYELDSQMEPVVAATEEKQQQSQHTSTGKVQKAVTILTKEFPLYFKQFGFMALFKKLYARVIDLYYILFFLRRSGKKMAKAEEKLFAQEVKTLKNTSNLKPVKIHPDDVHSTGFLEQVKKLDPYFFLTLSGPLYRKPLLDSIRGAAINQHAGHSPLLKGSYTIHWALYHRELSHVSSTVHITTTGADAGQILRRSNPCIFPHDNVETVFLRTVALGTELMIESIREIMADKKVMVFKQPETAGKTYLNKDYNLHIAKAITRDFNAGWLRSELNRQKDF